MWIWISAGWLCCGVAAYLMIRNAWLYQNAWDGEEMASTFLISLSGPIAIIMALGIEGKDCFRRRRKMEKTYWNEKEQQITTKGGKCLYDKRSGDNLSGALASACTQIGQLECEYRGGGHKMAYRTSNWPRMSVYGVAVNLEHSFKCSNCGLEITKTKKELTPSEKEALKKLKVI